MASEGAKRGPKGRRPNELGVNKAILKDVPNSKMYVELRELDLRIEQYTNRKKAEICDINQPLELSTRCLRLYLYNHHAHQGSTDPQRPPSWSFHIYGSFVEPPVAAPHRPATAPATATAPTATAAPPGAQDPNPKRGADRFWTAAMATIELRISDAANADAPVEVVRWERERHVGQHKEAIEVHRVGSRPVKITVILTRYYAPELLCVKPPLATALGLPTPSNATRGAVLRALWKFINEHSTPDPADPSTVVADEVLLQLFGEPRLQLASVMWRLDDYLEAPAPVTLEYTVRLDGPSPTAPAAYDVNVGWSLRPALLKLPAFLERFDVRQQLEEYDKKIAEHLAALKQCHRKHQFLMGFATNPLEFIQKLVAASAREVRENNNVPSQISTSEHFKMPWAQEAAVHYLTKGPDQV